MIYTNIDLALIYLSKSKKGWNEEPGLIVVQNWSKVRPKYVHIDPIPSSKSVQLGPMLSCRRPVAVCRAGACGARCPVFRRMGAERLCVSYDYAKSSPV